MRMFVLAIVLVIASHSSAAAQVPSHFKANEMLWHILNPWMDRFENPEQPMIKFCREFPLLPSVEVRNTCVGDAKEVGKKATQITSLRESALQAAERGDTEEEESQWSLFILVVPQFQQAVKEWHKKYQTFPSIVIPAPVEEPRPRDQPT